MSGVPALQGFNHPTKLKKMQPSNNVPGTDNLEEVTSICPTQEKEKKDVELKQEQERQKKEDAARAEAEEKVRAAEAAKQAQEEEEAAKIKAQREREMEEMQACGPLLARPEVRVLLSIVGWSHDMTCLSISSGCQTFNRTTGLRDNI